MEPLSAFDQLKSQFLHALMKHDKTTCIQLITEALNQRVLTVPEVYEGILAPGLANIASNDKDQEIAIWEEHVQSGIVRTIIELCYPYILDIQAQDQVLDKRPKAIVFCQEEEYHELGARMSTDFLTLLGFNAFFIGANTPKREVFKALKAVNPKMICISITNYYHLSKLEDLITELRGCITSGELEKFVIVVGGYAIEHTPYAKNKIKPDYFAQSFADLKLIKEAMGCD